MIKFFRTIRKSLLMENKKAKYFKYAIGEIILVVIGILIALSINNWNENRIKTKKETKILNTLLKDLSQAQLMSESLIDSERKHIRLYELILGNRVVHEQLLKNQKIDSIFHQVIFNLTSQVPVIYAYNDLKNAGETNLISNEIIRGRFSLLEKKIIDLNRQLEDRLEVQQLRIDGIAINEINFVQTLKALSNTYNISYGPENDYKKLLQDQKFLNAIGVKLALSDDALINRISLFNEIKDLSKLIEIELNHD
jgi:hypothetical protein